MSSDGNFFLSLLTGLSIRRPNLLLGIIVKQKKVMSQRFLKQQQQQQQQQQNIKPVDPHGKPLEKKQHPPDVAKIKPVDPRRRYHPPPQGAR